MDFPISRISMHTICIIILFTIAQLLSLSNVHASDELVLKDAKFLNNPSPMYDAIHSPEAYESMEKFTRAIDSAYGIGCDTDYKLEVIRLIVAQPIVISKETGNIAEGLWYYRYRAERCDQTKIYNIAAVKRSGSGAANPEIKYVLFAPGTTEAGIRLVYDTLKLVYPGILLKSEAIRDEKNNDCARRRLLFDTEYLSKNALGWKEKWTVKACGELISSIVTFTSDGNGGNFISVK